MTLDAHTGFITLSEIGAFISPSLLREQFLQNTAFAGASELGRNGAWCSYRLLLIDQERSQLSVMFQFEGEHLRSLRLAHMAPQFGSGWDDWSEAREQERKAFHEQWLAHELGVSPGRHPWGDISSSYDVRSGTSSLTLTYRNESQPANG